MGLLDEINIEETDGYAKALQKRVIAICMLMGNGDVYSDDSGDRYLEIYSPDDSKLRAEVHSTYSDDGEPIWKIIIVSSHRENAEIMKAMGAISEVEVERK